MSYILAIFTLPCSLSLVIPPHPSHTATPVSFLPYSPSIFHICLCKLYTCILFYILIVNSATHKEEEIFFIWLILISIIPSCIHFPINSTISFFITEYIFLLLASLSPYTHIHHFFSVFYWWPSRLYTYDFIICYVNNTTVNRDVQMAQCYADLVPL